MTKQQQKDFLLNLLGNDFSTKVEKQMYPNSKFLFKGDDLFIEIENNGNVVEVWCSHYHIWNPISTAANLDYIETRNLIKEVIQENSFKFLDGFNDSFIEVNSMGDEFTESIEALFKNDSEKFIDLRKGNNIWI